jgi:succinate dehydrogenase / fumarate reductase iron-sulfur subunit
MVEDKFILKIYRGSPGNRYWEEFELPYTATTNVISALMDIQKDPINRQGERVAPVAWESGCLEEVCGSCSMLIDGKPRQACTALIHVLLKQSQSNVVVLAPMSKFPLVRDLMIDRSSMFENLKKAHAWIDTDGAFDRGPGPKISQKTQEVMYALSKCMTCGCCVEACPQINEQSPFMGPQIISQVRLFNLHPTGAMQADVRLKSMMDEGGVGGCGNAQNCVRVCPQNIPLTDSIAAIGRAVTFKAIKDIFGKD